MTGGKWTTYRAMAEDVLERCMARGLLPHAAGGVTERLPLLWRGAGRPLAEPPGEHLYGSEAATAAHAARRRALAVDRRRIGRGALSEAMVRFAARYEMATTVEDVLARRCRLLFLDAAEAARQADGVAAILAEELGGGFDAEASWTLEGRETTSETVSTGLARYRAEIRPELLADKSWMTEHHDDPDVRVIDSRTREEYDGEVLYGEARGGHIPGARMLMGSNALIALTGQRCVPGRFLEQDFACDDFPGLDDALHHLLRNAGQMPGRLEAGDGVRLVSDGRVRLRRGRQTDQSA